MPGFGHSPVSERSGRVPDSHAEVGGYEEHQALEQSGVHLILAMDGRRRS